MDRGRFDKYINAPKYAERSMAHATVVQLMKAIGVQIGAYEEGFETLCGRDDVVLIKSFHSRITNAGTGARSCLWMS